MPLTIIIKLNLGPYNTHTISLSLLCFVL